VYPTEGVFSVFTAKVSDILLFCYFDSMGVS
jgi:hypothetical protein